MGFSSVEGDAEVFQSHGLYVHAGIRGGMHHQRDVDILKAAVFLHDDLAAQAFLGGRSVYHDFVRPVARKLADTQRRADRGRALHVMAAAVAHGQGVILGEQAEGRPSFSLLINRAEGMLHAAHIVLHMKTVLLQKILQKLTGLHLLAADLRQVKNTVRHFLQLRTQLIDISFDLFFHGNLPSPYVKIPAA